MAFLSTGILQANHHCVLPSLDPVKAKHNEVICLKDYQTEEGLVKVKHNDATCLLDSETD